VGSLNIQLLNFTTERHARQGAHSARVSVKFLQPGDCTLRGSNNSKTCLRRFNTQPTKVGFAARQRRARFPIASQRTTAKL